MITLVQSVSASSLVHTVPTDPGTSWVRDATVAIEAPPESEVALLPEAQWSAQGVRTSVCGVVAPRVISPGRGVWDAAKCSEMCAICLPRREEQAPRYRMLYEASDGTAKDQRGVWRIASAIG